MEERRRTWFEAAGLIADGRVLPWWAATVHYWRTPRAAWPRALAALRGLGLTMIEAPVPWGVHERRAGGHDFAGALDLGGFLDQAHAAGLAVAVALGPMTDGEQTFAGLPERIVRDEAMWARGAHGGPAWIPMVPQAFPLPSFASAGFLDEVEAWHRAAAAVIAPRCGPGGPVVAIGLDAGVASIARGAAFDLDYHPDAIAAWRALHGDDPPRRWSDATAGAAAAWIRWKGEHTGRALVRLSAALDDAGLGGLARFGTAPPIDPQLDELVVPWPRAIDLASGTRDPAVVARRMIISGSGVQLARVPAGHSPLFAPTTAGERADVAIAALTAGATGLTWHMGVARDRWIGGLCSADGTPTAEAAQVAAIIAAATRLGVPALRPRADVALVVSRADTRHGVASALVDPAPAAALELLGLGPAGAAALAADADAALARRWFDAVARALALAQVAAVRVDERAALAAVPARRFVVPTLTRVDRALWRQLHRLAADRRVVVIGPSQPSRDELGAPLGADAAPPRRAGTMRPGSLDDVAGLAADLAALAPRDTWLVEPAADLVATLLEDAGGQVRAICVHNPTARAVRARLVVPTGAALRDAVDDQPYRNDAGGVTLTLPAGGLRWLAVDDQKK